MIKNFLWQTRVLLSSMIDLNRAKILGLIFAGMLIIFWSALIPFISSAAGGHHLPELFLTNHNGYWQLFLNSLNHRVKYLYFSRYLPLDMLFPFVYGFLLTFILIRQTDHIFEITSNFKLLYYLPLAAADADLLENILSAILIWNYPNISVKFQNIVVFITFIKFSLLIISIAIMLIFFIKIGYSRFQRS